MQLFCVVAIYTICMLMLLACWPGMYILGQRKEKILQIARRPRRTYKDEDKVVSSELCAVVKTTYSLAVSSQHKYAAADDHFLSCTEHVNEHKVKLNIIKKQNHCS